MSFGEGDLHAQVDRLKDVNGSLCAEINRQERVIERQQAEYAELAQINHRYAERVRELESLVRRMYFEEPIYLFEQWLEDHGISKEVGE